MHKLYAQSALIGSQWQTNITLSISAEGVIQAIDKGQDADAVALNGPIVPGMVNCHSHAFQRAFAGYSEYRGESEDSFWSWRDIMYRFVAKMSPQDAFDVARFVYLQMLKAGYTAVGEFHYLHHQTDGRSYNDPLEMSHQVIHAANSCGIAYTHLPVLYTYAGFGKKSPSKGQARFIHSTDNYLSLVSEINKQYSEKANFKLGIAPHSLRAVDESQLKEIVPYIRQIDPLSPIHIHIAEQLQEVEDCVNHYQKRPVEWLLDNYSMDEHWCLIHATHLSSQEIKTLAQSSAAAGLCLTTEANLGDGIFPTDQYLKLGGSFAIGSDSHIGVNVAEELRLLEYAQRLTKHQRAVLVGSDCSSVGQYLYTKAANDGASAIGQNVGTIEVGKRADFLVLDENHPSLFSKSGSNLLDAAIFACNELPVRDVFVAGKKVIESGNHPLEKEILSRYRSVLANLVEDS